MYLECVRSRASTDRVLQYLISPSIISGDLLEMDHDQRPQDHTYADGGASWHPALRVEKESDLPTPAKPNDGAAESAIPLDKDTQIPSQQPDSSDDEDFFTRQTTTVPQPGTDGSASPTLDLQSQSADDSSKDIPVNVDESLQAEADPEHSTEPETFDSHQQPAPTSSPQTRQNIFTPTIESWDAGHDISPEELPATNAQTTDPWGADEADSFLEQPEQSAAEVAADNSEPEIDPESGNATFAADQEVTDVTTAQDTENEVESTGKETTDWAQYEHQGEVTAADEAVDETPSAPLLEDEQPAPTPGWDTTATEYDALGIQAQPEQDSLLTAQETTLAESQDEQQSADPFDWGASEDADASFEEVLGIKNATEQEAEAPVGSDNAEQDMTFGGVAASRMTALSQVLQEGEGSTTLQVDATATGGGDADDLAALWKAALDDDEFLDDAGAVDPSGFFEDDGEGFLDEAEPPITGVISPTQPVPIFNEQGKMEGFSSLAHAQSQNGGAPSVSRYQPEHVQQQTPATSRNQYAPDSPQFFNSAFQNSITPSNPSTTPFGAYGQTPYASTPSQPPSRPAGPQTAQSFVDKSKGGYSSPYDLPMDIVKQPRKRPTGPTVPAAQPTPPPPPRSSSMMSQPSVTSPVQSAFANAPMASMSPPTSSHSGQSVPPTRAAPVNTVKPSQGESKDKSGFFEELPLVPKPRSRPSGAYTPSPAATPAVPQGPPSRPPLSSAPSMPTIPSMLSQPSQLVGGLRQPERLPLLPDTPPAAQASQAHQPSAPAPSSRYSPAVPSAPSAPSAAARFSPMPPPAPAANARYSPAPPNSGPMPGQDKYAPATASTLPRQAQPFAPRTSSPLAYHTKPETEAPMPPPRSASYQPLPRQGSLNKPMPSLPVESASNGSLPSGPTFEVGSPPRQALPPRMVASPSRASAYSPSASIASSPESKKNASRYSPLETRVPDMDYPPPRRPRTQSPGAVMKGPKASVPWPDRPTSALDSPVVSPQQGRTQLALPHRRQFSSDLNFAVPQDERASDPLERWRGHPIFKFGASGSILTSFPTQTPFYAAGHAIPTVKCSAGPITIHEVKTTFPLDDRDAKFPGPLSGKGKGKKKDLVTWMSGKIEDLERSTEGALLDINLAQPLKKRAEEKLVLWKMVKVLLETDNVLEGNPAVEEAARKILLPNLAQSHASTTPLADAADTGLKADIKNPEALLDIRRHLLEGQRERAVWYAAEEGLWSHALLISSTLGPDVRKQVVQEFVRSQVKDSGENAQSLAALYEVFAGNFDESIDELVPPSARAGFQMVSKSDTFGASAKNPLEGLDQWRETLGLIIGNRTPGDGQAVAALGKLLANYGRAEAAHTCFLFSRAFIKQGGSDDPQTNFVLLGSDHQAHPLELGLDLDSIILTEVYEYALSLNPVPGTSPVIPHLQAYKLMHAHALAEHGLRTEALAYCNSIGDAIKSSTRASPYYHIAFAGAVDDLTRCLSQAPQTSSSSGWISKPSMDKVSGSMWNKFNKFVAGDDDQGSAGTGAGGEGGDAAGPFGKVSGDTPSVSRNVSATDLYSAMSLTGGATGTSGAPVGRYAPSAAGSASHLPAGRYAPQASSTYAPSRGSLESTRSYEPERPGTGHSTNSMPQRAISTPYGAYLPQAQQTQVKPMQTLAPEKPDMQRAASDYRVQYSQPPSRRPSTQDEVGAPYTPQLSFEHSSPSAYQPTLGQPNPPKPADAYSPSPLYGDDPVNGIQHNDPQSASYEPPSFSYEPPVHEPSEQPQESSYEPPSFSYEPPVHGLSDQPQASSYEPPTSSYEPPKQSSTYEPPTYEPHTNEHGDEPPTSTYEPPTSTYEPPTLSYEPPASTYEPPTSTYEPPTSSYEPPTSSYEPPTSSYEPPSPETYRSEAPTGQTDSPPQPGKPSMMDPDETDDQIMQRAAALAAKSAADREADEAFKRAAEEDAKRDAAKNGDKKGWFGWFGKKDPNAQPGPIRAKLGEQNSFYYDADLKKWVNKKGGETPTAAAPTPPPPKGPSRAASGQGGPPAGPPTGPPSRAPSGAALAGMGSPPMGMGRMPPSGPPSRVGTPGQETLAPHGGMPPSGPPSAPPSRPPTSMSAASSIDDLLGAPAPRKGGTVKGKKRGGRYVDVMAK